MTQLGHMTKSVVWLRTQIYAILLYEDKGRFLSVSSKQKTTTRTTTTKLFNQL